MNRGSGPAGEVTMDDIRQRLASVSARFAAVKERASDAVLNAGPNGEPGQPQPDQGTDG